MKPCPQSFLYAEADGVARLTLNRPQAMNALTFEVYRELTDTFRALASRQDLRCAVITGSGRAFCTGGDVKDIIGPLLARDRAALHAFTTLTCDLIRAMRALPFPIVASLNGTVAGAGAMIAIAADFRVAAESAKIAFLFVKVGLAGADMGAAWLLPRLIGQSRATELLLLGDFVDAEEARRIGLYHRVCPHERLADETAALVARLVAGPAAGLAATKDALEREAHMTLEEALRHEAHVQAELMPRDDFAEGHRAFVEKRAPRFVSPRGERP
ncbi:MAG: enoyl-CoA hydratase family protein [Vicinamibacteria bacterium]|nr:enoyl-CoA hydratase family protein [Vicinamibacteria bacterium]